MAKTKIAKPNAMLHNGLFLLGKTMTDFLPPPMELVQQWDDEGAEMFRLEYQLHLATRAAQWGADQELEACCEWLGDAPVVYNDNGDLHPGSYLRDARRPKPPSLKQQALEAMHRNWNPHNNDDFATIARALEALSDD
jgi:hypothetical protein